MKVIPDLVVQEVKVDKNYSWVAVEREMKLKEFLTWP
jgi:hypothetical protein